MSIVAIVSIAGGAIAVAYFVWFIAAGFETPPETFERWHEERHQDDKPKSPELGTIRLVEKMDENGEVYYVVRIHARWFNSTMHQSRLRWEELLSHCAGSSETFGTVEEAQEAANVEIDRRKAEKEAKADKAKRAAHHEIVGEFKP